MNQVSSNGLTLIELEQIEEAAHHAHTLSPESVLRLTAALREALQIKVNACALCPICHKSLSPDDLKVSVDPTKNSKED